MRKTIAELEQEILDRRLRIIDLAHEPFEVNGFKVTISTQDIGIVSATVEGCSIIEVHRSKGPAIVAGLMAHDICRACLTFDPHTIHGVACRVLSALGV